MTNRLYRASDGAEDELLSASPEETAVPPPTPSVEEQKPFLSYEPTEPVPTAEDISATAEEVTEQIDETVDKILHENESAVEDAANELKIVLEQANPEELQTQATIEDGDSGEGLPLVTPMEEVPQPEPIIVEAEPQATSPPEIPPTIPEEPPSVEEPPVIEDTPAVEEPPVVEEVPAVEETPAVVEPPVVEGAPAVEESPAVEEPPVAEDTSSDESVPDPVPEPVPENPIAEELVASVEPASEPVTEDPAAEELVASVEPPLPDESAVSVPAVEEIPAEVELVDSVEPSAPIELPSPAEVELVQSVEPQIPKEAPVVTAPESATETKPPERPAPAEAPVRKPLERAATDTVLTNPQLAKQATAADPPASPTKKPLAMRMRIQKNRVVQILKSRLRPHRKATVAKSASGAHAGASPVGSGAVTEKKSTSNMSGAGQSNVAGGSTTLTETATKNDTPQTRKDRADRLIKRKNVRLKKLAQLLRSQISKRLKSASAAGPGTAASKGSVTTSSTGTANASTEGSSLRTASTAKRSGAVKGTFAKHKSSAVRSIVTKLPTASTMVRLHYVQHKKRRLVGAKYKAETRERNSNARARKTSIECKARISNIENFLRGLAIKESELIRVRTDQARSKSQVSTADASEKRRQNQTDGAYDQDMSNPQRQLHMMGLSKTACDHA